MDSSQQDCQAQTPMPRYECHKKVWALKIKSVAYKGEDVRLEFDGHFGPRTENVESKPKPEAGWYLVQYEDGYISFSPAKQFEEGYTLVAPKPRPSISELEDILMSDEDRPITINSDGSISAA